jgi:PAS domain S-box-containing protein
MKDNLSRLVPAVERELKEAEARRARRRAEADLRESERRFRFLAEQMIDIVWTADRNFRTTYVSPSVTRVLGFSPEERLRQSMEEAVTPSTYAAIMKRFEEEMTRQQTEGIDPDRAVVMEVEYWHKNGGTVWMENTVRGIWDDGGNLVGFHGVARDLTERKQAEAALREKQARLEDAYRLAHLGIWNWDRETGALFWSDELYRLFGRDPGLPPPSPAEHARLYAPGCWERQREKNRRALQTGESYEIELEYTHSDGTRRWIISFGGPLYDPSGRIGGSRERSRTSRNGGASQEFGAGNGNGRTSSSGSMKRPRNGKKKRSSTTPSNRSAPSREAPSASSTRSWKISKPSF